MTEQQREIIAMIKGDKKTEQVAFRCTPEMRKRIEGIGKSFGFNISQTVELMITSVMDDLGINAASEKRIKSMPKSDLRP